MEIPLTQGKVTIVDDVDADLAAFKWYAAKSRKTFYARRSLRDHDGEQTSERLHQVIARRMGIVGLPDHRDRNGLNNRRSNLRSASGGQNLVNRAGWSRSGFKGVTWYDRLGKWLSNITVDGKTRHLGYFTESTTAALVRDTAALEASGEFAVLNFPRSCPGQHGASES